MKPDLKALIFDLEAIAEMNDDRFRYRIDIEPINNSLRFSFVCEETEDNHIFLSQWGSTLESAIVNSGNDMANACRLWGYKQPK